jgi:hypothetical protein
LKPFLIAACLIALVILLFFGIKVVGSDMAKEDSLVDIVDQVRNGDIIFQTSLSRQSQAIQLATHSKYSHMGIIYIEGGKPFVYEAVQPVKVTPLPAWIKRGKDGKCVVKRLKDADTILTPETLKKMKTVGHKYKGKNYDI